MKINKISLYFKQILYNCYTDFTFLEFVLFLLL